MALAFETFTVPVISGPSQEKLDDAIKAISEAQKVKKASYAEAEAKKHRSTFMSDSDYEFYCVILTRACLRWTLKGRLLNYRVNAQADTVYKLGDNYVVEFTHHNKHARHLSSPSNYDYLIEPKTYYDFRIVYNPLTKIGRVSMLGKSIHQRKPSA